MPRPQLSIAAKLWLAPGFAIALMVIMSLLALTGLQRQGAALDNIYLVRFANVDAASNAASYARVVHAQSYRYLSLVRASYSPAQLDQLLKSLDANLAKLNQQLIDLETVPLTESELDLLRRAQEATLAYRKELKDALDLADSDVSTATTMMEPASKSHDQLLAAIQNLGFEERRLSEQAFSDARAALQITVIVLATLLALAALTCTFMTHFVRQRILRSVISLRATAGRLSDGDLRPRSAIYPADELGATSKELEGTLGRLRDIVDAIQQTSVTTMEAASEISVGTTDLSQRTEEQAATLQVTAAAMLQLTRTVRQNAESAQQLQALAAATDERAAEGEKAMRGVVLAMHGIAERADSINEIISIIDGIAFQTNILALNASVEAARAGEAGRGFAVVAGAVRVLATRSADAAGQIRKMITESSGQTAQGGELVGAAGGVMQEIVTSVQGLKSLSQAIAQASATQARDIDRVGDALAAIDHGTQQNAALAEQTAAASDSLTRQAERMKSDLMSFRVHDDSISDTTEQFVREGCRGETRHVPQAHL